MLGAVAEDGEDPPRSSETLGPLVGDEPAAIVERRTSLPADDQLAQHAANTIARHSRRGWPIDKPDDRTPNDAIIALAMAVDAAEDRPEPVRLHGFL